MKANPLVELVLDEELGCFESVTGFEAVELGPHDGEQKVDDADAVVGPVLDYVCEVHGLEFTAESYVCSVEDSSGWVWWRQGSCLNCDSCDFGIYVIGEG